MTYSIKPFLTVSLALITGFSHAQSAKLRVMTYNIHHANPPSAGDKIDLNAISKVIKDAKPDLVALQELDRFTARSGVKVDELAEIARAAGMNLFFFSAMDYDGGEYGVGVLSRLEIIDSLGVALPKVISDGENRAVAMIKIKTSAGQSLYFGSTHLDTKTENRVFQAKKLAEVVGKLDAPLLLGGDFNDIPGSETINILDGALTRSCANDCPNTIPVEKPNKAIDFIFTSAKQVKFLTTQTIPEIYASDHLPVVVELELP